MENQLYSFLFKGMKVYTYSKPLDNWVPDAFSKRILVRVQKGKVTFDEMNPLLEFSQDSNSELEEEDFL